MKVRSYEYHALVRNLGKEDEETLIRGTLEGLSNVTHIHAKNLGPKDSLHLVRITNITKWERTDV